MKNTYKDHITKLTSIKGIEFFQLRIESDKGFYILEVNPNNKTQKIIKDRLKNE